MAGAYEARTHPTAFAACSIDLRISAWSDSSEPTIRRRTNPSSHLVTARARSSAYGSMVRRVPDSLASIVHLFPSRRSGKGGSIISYVNVRGGSHPMSRSSTNSIPNVGSVRSHRRATPGSILAPSMSHESEMLGTIRNISSHRSPVTFQTSSGDASISNETRSAATRGDYRARGMDISLAELSVGKSIW